MDFHSPAQCNGTVVEWNYCFYGNRIGRSAGDVYGVKFMVYRSSNVTGVYNIVNNSLHYLKMDYELLPTHGIGCSNVTLNTTQQFQILQNDIIAACVLDSNSEEGINPLYVARTWPNQAYHIEVECTDDQLNSIELINSGYRIRDLLRLNASIMNSECAIVHIMYITAKMEVYISYRKYAPSDISGCKHVTGSILLV